MKGCTWQDHATLKWLCLFATKSKIKSVCVCVWEVVCVLQRILMPFSACHHPETQQFSTQFSLSAFLNFVIKSVLSGEGEMPYHPKCISQLGNLPCFLLLCCYSEYTSFFKWTAPVDLIFSVFGLGNKPKTSPLQLHLTRFSRRKPLLVFCYFNWKLR